MYHSKCWSKYNQLNGVRCWSVSLTKGKSSVKSKNHLRCNATSSRSSGNGYYLGASLATVGLVGMGTAVYAKYDENVRRSIESSLPFMKPVFTSLYGNIPNQSLLPPVEKDLSIVFQPMIGKEPLLEGIIEEEPVIKIEPTAEPIEAIDRPFVIETTPFIENAEQFSASLQDVPTPAVNNVSVAPSDSQPLNTISTEVQKEVRTDTAPDISEVEKSPENHAAITATPLTPEEIQLLSEVVNRPALEVVLEASAEHLKSLVESTKVAQYDAAKSIRDYYKNLSDVVYIPTNDKNYEQFWENATNLEYTSQEIINKAKTKEFEFKNWLITVTELISSIRKMESASEVADEAEKVIQSCNIDIALVSEDLKKAEDELSFFLNFQTFVMNAPEKLKQELQKFTPDLLKLLPNTKEEWEGHAMINGLLALALKQRDVVLLKHSEEELIVTKQFEELLNKRMQELEEAADNKLILEIKKVEKEKAVEQEQKLKELEQKYDLEMLSQLKRQASAHNIHLTEELERQAKTLSLQHEAELKTRLNERRQIYEFELEKKLASVQGIQSKITDIVNVERQQRRIQELWLATQALNSALEESLFNGRTRTLMPELLSIVHLGGAGMLQEIIETIPETAAKFGVVPEKELKQRFKHVKNVCQKVALIDEKGGGIGSYLLSYIKSLFVYSGWYQRNANDYIDLANLGPYEILAKAEYFVNEGDLEQAAKFMSQLRGVARKMSSDWLKEVRILLETKQTVNLLIAYAASLHAGVDFQQNS